MHSLNNKCNKSINVNRQRKAQKQSGGGQRGNKVAGGNNKRAGKKVSPKEKERANKRKMSEYRESLPEK